MGPADLLGLHAAIYFKGEKYLDISSNFLASTVKKKGKRNGSRCIVRAACSRLFTGAIPILLHTGTFACCVSALGRSVPP